jgi:hypothetical protein
VPVAGAGVDGAVPAASTGSTATTVVAAPFAGATESTCTVVPATWTCCGTRSAGTSAGRYTPNGVAADGPPDSPYRPGMLASAVSMNALLKARPTLRSSGSFTVIRHDAVAASLDVGSVWSVRTTRVRTEAKSSGPYGQAAQNAASTTAAFSSTSSPVNATATSLR